jgi:hypothetical protein
MYPRTSKAPIARLKDIFPGGFDARFGVSSSSSRHGSHFSSKPEQLYHSLVERYDPETPIEDIIVKSAWYGKQTNKTAQHEFIVVQVEDTRINGLFNYLVLDRNAENYRGPSSSSSSRANDAFKVSYDGDIKKLLEECQLMPYKYLESLSFPSDEPLHFYELVTLADVVSNRYPDYQVFDSSCYLFAGLVWECMRRMRPTAEYKDALARKRGKCRWLRYVPSDSAREETHKEIQDTLPMVESCLEGRRNVRSFRLMDFRNMLIPFSLLKALSPTKADNEFYERNK